MNEPVSAPHTPTPWERFRGGFLQGWRDDSPNYSWWGKLQGYIVAGALVGIGIILLGVLTLALIR